MASTGSRNQLPGDVKNGAQKKSSALGRFMSFIRKKNKDKEPHVNKRGVSARQKSTDSGISSNRDTFLNSDENLPDPGLGNKRPCSTIKVVRNNSHIQTTNTGKINSNYNNNNNATKRTQSTLGGRNKAGRPNINVKRSNTSIGNSQSSMGMIRMNRHNMGHTSDSSTSSTGYISDHRNRNNYRDHNNNFRESNNRNNKNSHHNKYNSRRRDQDQTSASESSSEEYSSSDNSSYTSEDSSPKKNIKKKKKSNAHNKRSKYYYHSEEDDTSLAATSIADSHRYSDEEDRDKEDANKDASPAQLEVIPEGEEEEERYLQSERKRIQDMHVSDRINRQAKQSTKYTQNKNSRKPMHSYHGNSPNFYEDDDECLLQESQRNRHSRYSPNKKLQKGRSHSTDATTNHLRAADKDRQSEVNWRKSRKSFGENQLESLPPRPDASKSGRERTMSAQSGGVRAIVNKIQTQTESQEDNVDSYLASKFEYVRKLGRASREGHLSEENTLDDMLEDNDDPLFEPQVRRAGMAQNREGRALISRKNSFNSTKQAKESGKMEDHEKDQDVNSEGSPLMEQVDRPKPRGATVQRSTSRVKMMAKSLQERETVVRKTEEMIANHVPLGESQEGNRKSQHNLAEEQVSSGFPSPQNAKSSDKEKQNDDSFIKELLEIARAESQEKQKSPEITFTPALLKNMTNIEEDKSMSSPEQEIKKNVSNELNNKRVTGNSQENLSSKKQDDTKPKDFKEAISMASTRLAKKKNSKDCTLDKDAPDAKAALAASASNPDTHEDNDLVQTQQIKKNVNLNKSSSMKQQIEQRKLPYSTVNSTGRRRRLNSSDILSNRHSTSTQNQYSIGERAKIFEQSPERDVSHRPKSVVNPRSSPARAASFSHANIYTANKPPTPTNHNIVNNSQSSYMPHQNDCSSSSGIHSGNPDDDGNHSNDQKSPASSDYSDSIKNHKQYYDNLVHRVKNLKQTDARNNTFAEKHQPDSYEALCSRDGSQMHESIALTARRECPVNNVQAITRALNDSNDQNKSSNGNNQLSHQSRNHNKSLSNLEQSTTKTVKKQIKVTRRLIKKPRAKSTSRGQIDGAQVNV